MTEPLTVRQVIAELRRFDPDAPVVVGGLAVKEIGCRERPAVGIHPQLYLAAAQDQDRP